MPALAAAGHQTSRLSVFRLTAIRVEPWTIRSAATGLPAGVSHGSSSIPEGTPRGVHVTGVPPSRAAAPHALAALGLGKDQAGTNDFDLPPDADHASAEVEVIDGKPKNLTLSHSASSAQVDQHLVAVREVAPQGRDLLRGPRRLLVDPSTGVVPEGDSLKRPCRAARAAGSGPGLRPAADASASRRRRRVQHAGRRET